MTKINTTKYSVGDKVVVKKGKEHDGMEDMGEGTIKEISTPALGIQFEGSSKIHKWYVDEEIEAADAPSSPSKEDTKKDDKKKKDKGMDMELPEHHRWLLKGGIPTRTKD